jgi:hypothetical protein
MRWRRVGGFAALGAAAALAVGCPGSVANTYDNGWGDDGGGRDARADSSSGSGGSSGGGMEAGRDGGGPGSDAGGSSSGGDDGGNGGDATADAGGCMQGATESCAVCGTTGTSTCGGGGTWGACAPPGGICAYVDQSCSAACDTLASCWTHVDRSYDATTGEHFYTTSDAEAACCGFTVEAYKYYWLYAAPQSGLVPFYRCLLMSGFHFYTTDMNCEGAAGAKNEGMLGYIATSAVCGSTALYRLYDGTNGDHFYTTSAAESSSAQANGYVLESTAGYVWPAPQ